ncbi:hypothetical protein [Corynebacterium aurimucosum]|uniref:hypothetical protein n=1 Tax=Corynebacterium aurimucosum TaxID=169292 RepID=UPI0037581C20
MPKLSPLSFSTVAILSALSLASCSDVEVAVDNTKGVIGPSIDSLSEIVPILEDTGLACIDLSEQGEDSVITEVTEVAGCFNLDRQDQVIAMKFDGLANELVANIKDKSEDPDGQVAYGRNWAVSCDFSAACEIIHEELGGSLE